MAKQLVNPIERHAEKVVLAIAGAVLLYAIAFYLITTPNTLELGTDKVTPQTIDMKVAQKANEALDRIRSANPPVKIPDPVFDTFDSLLAPLDGKPLPAAVLVNPDVPIFDVSTVIGRSKLAEVVKPDKPLTTQGRSTFALSVQGQQQDLAMDWVTIAVAFNVKGQMDVLKKTYGATKMDVIYGPSDLQRRTRRADGTWSDGDWKDITPSPAATLPKESRLNVDESGGGNVFTSKEDEKSREKFLESLRDPALQREIVRPMMHTRVNGAVWKFPLFGSYHDVLMMDDELLKPLDAPAVEPADIYGLSGTAAKTTTTAPKSPEQQLKLEMESAQKLLESAQKDMSPDQAVQAFNKFKDVRDSKDASPALKQQAQTAMNVANQAENDIRRKKREGAAPVANKGGSGGTGETSEGLSKRPPTVRLPMQEVWANDAQRDSLRGGEAYQYRMRLRIYNNLAGVPDKLENPKDAAKTFLTSDWSEPSDPVTIEPSSYFFVTGDDKSKGDVNIEFYRWFDGVWVKAPRAFKATIGATVADTMRTKVPGLDDPNVPDNPEVSYTANAMVLDIDFDHPMRERKESGSGPKKGVRFAPNPTVVPQVAFLGNDGRLFGRDTSTDRANPQRRVLEGIIYKAKKQ